MAFTVQDLLDLPLMGSARAEVVVGTHLDRRDVRWVHTSEIYEISPLLKGGEVLLTTGLGLVGMSDASINAYVRSLARQNAAALLFELGRTFTRAPAALRAAAQEHGLPLVLMHGVVPFIEITEAVHPILISTELDNLRLLDLASVTLNRALLNGRGIKHLVAIVSNVCEAPAGLYSPDDNLLAGDDVKEAAGQAVNLIEVEVGAGPSALLTVQAGDTPHMRRLVEMSAVSIGIYLSQTAQVGPNRRLAGADLLRDIAEGRYVSGAELTSRASTVGFAVRPGRSAVGIAIDTASFTSEQSGLIATAEAARKSFGPCLVTELDGQVLVAASLRADELRARLGEFADAIDAELQATSGGSLTRLTAGPLVDDVAGLARSVPSAREGAQFARKLTVGSRVMLTADLGVYHLLSGVANDSVLERFVEEQLGPLLEHDARTGSDLMLTLDTFLESGLSKTAAASALRIRRQTMYGRLERIAGLLGGFNLNDRQRLTTLDLALTTWRMRTSAATRRSK